MIIRKEHINALVKQLFIHMVRGYMFRQLQSILNSEILLLGHTTKSHHIAVGWNFYQQGRTISFSLFGQVQSGRGSSGGAAAAGAAAAEAVAAGAAAAEGGSSGRERQQR